MTDRRNDANRSAVRTATELGRQVPLHSVCSPDSCCRVFVLSGSDLYLSTSNYNVLLTTFEFAMRDKKFLRHIPWEYILVDEAHRLKNPKCRLVQDLQLYSPRARRVALTGTPLQNDLHELWSLLNFLHPSMFNAAAADNFEKWFAAPFAGSSALPGTTAEGGGGGGGGGGVTEEEKLLIIDCLHSFLLPFMLRREKKEVETQLAAKIEKVLRCDVRAYHTPLQHAAP
jgi:SNF2 family DNA or RNA helicase